MISQIRKSIEYIRIYQHKYNHNTIDILSIVYIIIVSNKALHPKLRERDKMINLIIEIITILFVAIGFLIVLSTIE